MDLAAQKIQRCNAAHANSAEDKVNANVK